MTSITGIRTGTKRRAFAGLLAVGLLAAAAVTVAYGGDGSNAAAAKELRALFDQSVTLLRGYLAAIDRSEFDLDAKAKALGPDASAIFAFVRDEIRFEPYRGVLRGAAGCLRSRAGNAADKALLLAELLRRNGLAPRFAFGTLSEEDAAALVASSRDLSWPGPEASELDLPYRLDAHELVQERAVAVEALTSRLVDRQARLLAALDATLGDRAKGANDAIAARVDAAAIEDSRHHVWVRLRRPDGGETDLDPVLEEAEADFALDPTADPERDPKPAPGTQAEAAVPLPRPKVEEIADELPDGLWHRLTLRAFFERRQGEKVVEETLFQSARRAADLAGVPIVFECGSPAEAAAAGGGPGGLGGLGGALGGTAAGGTLRKAMLRVDGALVASSSFDLGEPLKTGRGGQGGGGLAGGLGGALGRKGPGPAPAVVSVGIEVGFVVPGEGAWTALSPIRRYVFRSPKPDSVAVSRLDGTSLCFAVETGTVSPAFLQAKSISAGIADFEALAIDGEKVRYVGGPQDAGACLLGEAFFHIFDAFAEGRLERRGFAAVPRLVMAELVTIGGKTTLAFDVTRDAGRLFGDGDLYRTNLEAGLLAAIVEEEVTLDPLDPPAPEAAPYGSARALEDALPRGLPLVVEKAELIPSAAPPDARALMGAAIAAGRILAIPSSRRTGAGGAGAAVPYAWFELDPSNGRLEATLETGLHQGMTERSGTERPEKTAAGSRFGNVARKAMRCVGQNIGTAVNVAIDAGTGGIGAGNVLDVVQGVGKCLSKAKGAKAERKTGPRPPKNHKVTRDAERHLKDRHVGNRPGWEHKSKWNDGGEWRRSTRETLKNPDKVTRDGNRWIYDKTFKHPVGKGPSGAPTHTVRTVVDNKGNVITSFPVGQ